METWRMTGKKRDWIKEWTDQKKDRWLDEKRNG
jgi:hypothetical protein